MTTMEIGGSELGVWRKAEQVVAAGFLALCWGYKPNEKKKSHRTRWQGQGEGRRMLHRLTKGHTARLRDFQL